MRSLCEHLFLAAIFIHFIVCTQAAPAAQVKSNEDKKSAINPATTTASVEQRSKKVLTNLTSILDKLPPSAKKPVSAAEVSNDQRTTTPSNTQKPPPAAVAAKPAEQPAPKPAIVATTTSPPPTTTATPTTVPLAVATTTPRSEKAVVAQTVKTPKDKVDLKEKVENSDDAFDDADDDKKTTLDGKADVIQPMPRQSQEKEIKKLKPGTKVVSDENKPASKERSTEDEQKATEEKAKAAIAKENEEKEKQRQALLQASASDPYESPGHFFTYIVIFGAVLVTLYVCLHNKNKILGLILEGRSGRRGSRGSRNGSGSARYRRLSANDNTTTTCVEVDTDQRNYVS